MRKSKIISKNINKTNITTKNKPQNSPQKKNPVDIRRNKKSIKTKWNTYI